MALQENTTGSGPTVLRDTPTLSNTVTIAGSSSQVGFLKLMDKNNTAYTAFSHEPPTGGPTNAFSFPITNASAGQVLIINNVLNSSGGQVGLSVSNVSQSSIVASNQIAGVLSNLTGVAGSTVTNENSAAFQINSGTLTASPGNFSNYVASSINVSVGNTFSNVAAVKTSILLPAITQSNLVVSFDTNSMQCIGLTNIVLTNIVEEAAGIRGDVTILLQNTLGGNLPIVWPAWGAQHGYFFKTNANNNPLIYTAVPAGKSATLSFTIFGTNVFASALEWP